MSDPLWYTRDGAVVREASYPEVYVVYAGRRWWIPTEQALYGMNYTWNDVRVVPDGTLAGLPRENVISDQPIPGVASTPSSLIWPPDGSERVTLDAPATRFLRSHCRDLHLVKLRGWIRSISDGCHLERPFGADWHLQIEVDPTSLDEIGGNVNSVVRAANVVWYRFPSTGPFTAVSRPLVDIEINGYRPGVWFAPSDWTASSDLQLPGDCNSSRWQYDPRLIPSNPSLVLNRYVEVKGSLLTDDPHYAQVGDQQSRDALYAWQGNFSQHDARNQARWTEIHAPDRIELLADRSQDESVYSAAVVSPSCFIGCQEHVLTYDLYPPWPRPSTPSQAVVTESVDGDTTTLDLLTVSNPTRTGAQLTVDPVQGTFVTMRVGVIGQTGLVRPGHFKATYRVTWGPCTPHPNCDGQCGMVPDGCGGLAQCAPCACGPATCPDGCCQSDSCVPGVSDSACGSGGWLCAACETRLHEHCIDGQCVCPRSDPYCLL